VCVPRLPGDGGQPGLHPLPGGRALHLPGPPAGQARQHAVRQQEAVRPGSQISPAPSSAAQRTSCPVTSTPPPPPYCSVIGSPGPGVLVLPGRRLATHRTATGQRTHTRVAVKSSTEISSIFIDSIVDRLLTPGSAGAPARWGRGPVRRRKPIGPGGEGGVVSGPTNQEKAVLVSTEGLGVIQPIRKEDEDRISINVDSL